MHDPTHEYDENCPGCQPAMKNLQTGEVLSNDHPDMVVVLSLFKTFSLSDRRAWHRVCLQNSRNADDLAIFKRISEQVATALQEQKE